jgi:heat shock protein HtpX
MVAAPPRQEVLVYHRIAHNRRNTWLLASLAIAAVFPFILGISLIVSAVVVARVGPHTHADRLEIRWEENYLQNSTDVPQDIRAAIERKLERQRKTLKADETTDSTLLIELTCVVSVGLIVILGILFWGIASSPTSKLLVQVGALPAGERDIEARRLLENLAIGAGLPFPKLYVIESSAPNAFAAGMDPYDAVIVVTRGALKLFDIRELEGVLAHELSHIGNHDIRLNTIVAVIALFLRIPYLIFKRELRPDPGSVRRRLGMWELALSPVGVYILFIAPALAAMLRAAVSREREFLADADAVLLTRYPEGLLRALGKIAGAGSVMTRSNPAYSHFYFANPSKTGQGWLNGSLLSTHPPLAERLERLTQFQGPAVGTAAVADAIKEGKEYAEHRPIVEVMELFPTSPDDELRVLNQGNPLGRVYRSLASDNAPVFDQPNRGSMVVAQLRPGALLVVFDDPGPFRQVNTAEQTFGYLDHSVKLQLLKDLIPAEVYDPKLREVAEAALPPFWAVTTAAPAVAQPAPKKAAALTMPQMVVVGLFVVVVFVGTFYILTKLG